MCWDVLYSETSKERLDRRVVFEMLLKKCKNEIVPLLCLNRWESWLCPYICINITHYLLMKFSSFCSLCEVEISVLLLYFKITSFQMKESESDDTANCFQSFGFRITLPPPNLCPQRPPCDPEVSAVYECWKCLILDGNNVQCKIESRT